MGQGSNPLSVLNSYHAGCQYELIEDSGPPHNKQFVFKVVIDGVAYTGKGNSKKRARQAAAASALRSIYNINLSLFMETPQPVTGPGPFASTPASYSQDLESEKPGLREPIGKSCLITLSFTRAYQA